MDVLTNTYCSCNCMNVLSHGPPLKRRLPRTSVGCSGDRPSTADTCPLAKNQAPMKMGSRARRRVCDGRPLQHTTTTTPTTNNNESGRPTLAMGLKRANNNNNPTPQPDAFATKARRAIPLRGTAPVVLGAPPSGGVPDYNNNQQPTKTFIGRRKPPFPTNIGARAPLVGFNETCSFNPGLCTH